MRFQSHFNNVLSWLQDMGIIAKLMDNGYYEAFGRNVQISFGESSAEKWEPLIIQGMILAFIAFGMGLILANLSFIIELSWSAWLDQHGSKKPMRPTMYNHNSPSSFCVATGNSTGPERWITFLIHSKYNRGNSLR